MRAPREPNGSRGVLLRMAARGPDWQAWVDALPRVTASIFDEWRLRAEGEPSYGHCSQVHPVRTADGQAAALKIGFPDPESEHEHLALRRWGGDGAVRLLRADPHRRALLLERALARDLGALPDTEACAVVAGLYRRLHVPVMPQLRTLASYVERWTDELASLPRSAPIPRRLVEQAVSVGHELTAEAPSSVIHADLHYRNVLAADRQPWLAIDPKPVNGDPHYEIAPMLWNRWGELAGDIRDGVRRRFFTLVDAAGFDEERARGWVIVRVLHNAMWELTDSPHPDPDRLTAYVAIAKAVQG
jgi:streptomycin 6-kinase